MSQPPKVDLFSPAFKANPYSTYAELRETAPIHRVTLPNGQGLWLVTRYDDAEAVLTDRRFVKNWYNVLTPEQLEEMAPIPKVLQPLSKFMLNMDPPDHTRLRELVQKAFTPRMVEQLRERIQAIADNLLDAVQDKGEMDIIDDYAFPLPIMVIAELLGVPIEDQHKFREWSNIIMSSSASEETAEGNLDKLTPAVEAFTHYLNLLSEEKRKHPKNDLISALIQIEEAGERLSEEELLPMVFMLLIAGHETTVNLIGNGVLALLQHPEQLEKLKSEPSLITSAVEELLRYDGPLERATSRFASTDITIGGTVIPKGDRVLVVLGSADRDCTHFSNPDELDITREDNKHLAFGKGIHYCLGAPLARLEGQIAISTLLRRMPNLQLKVAPEALTWRSSLLIRGLDSLPVVF